VDDGDDVELLEGKSASNSECGISRTERLCLTRVLEDYNVEKYNFLEKITGQRQRPTVVYCEWYLDFLTSDFGQINHFITTPVLGTRGHHPDGRLNWCFQIASKIVDQMKEMDYLSMK
jgi:hypothetical protein